MGVQLLYKEYNMKKRKYQHLDYLDNMCASLRLNIKLNNWPMAEIALDGIKRFVKDQKQISKIHKLDYNKLDGVNMAYEGIN